LVGSIENIMMGKPYLSNPIIKKHINGIEIPNTLIDLGVAIIS